MNIFEKVKEFTALTETEINNLVSAEAAAPAGTIICAGTWNGGDVMALTLANPDRRIIAIDSFSGLAQPSEEDLAEGAMTEGEMSVGGKEVYEDNFRRAEIELPEIHEIFIDKKTLSNIDPGSVAMLWLDLDHYQPTKDCLEYFHKFLSEDAIIIVHDYGFIRCPGIEKACNEYKTGWTKVAGGIYGLFD